MAVALATFHQDCGAAGPRVFAFIVGYEGQRIPHVPAQTFRVYQLLSGSKVTEAHLRLPSELVYDIKSVLEHVLFECCANVFTWKGENSQVRR